MAIIYFTSNADSGSGTLRAAINSAESGDVIMPDPNVFTSGPIVIPISSTFLMVNKSLTIDGGDLGIELDGQQTNIACVSLSYGATYTLINCTIKRFNRQANGPVYLNNANAVVNFYRCKIVDNQNRYYGACYVLAGTLNLYDTIVTGNNSTYKDSATYAGGIRLGANGYLNLIRSTVIYNTIANIYGGVSRQVRTNSFIGFTAYDGNGSASSLGDIEFVNPPESATIGSGANDWSEGLWRNYDFRLKPTSPYLTGAAYQTGDLDLLGHPRTGSWGCFDGSWLVVGASGAETVASAASVDWLKIASTGTLTLSGADRILTVTRGVFVVSGAAITSATRGYVVAPSASDCDAATLTNVVCCISGAGASNLSASTTGFSWSATDSTKTVVLEKQVSGAWTTVAQTSGTSYSETLSAGDSVRLFDGVNFLTATVVAPVFQFAKLYQAIVQTIALDSEQKEWTAVTQTITPWEYVVQTIAFDDDRHEWTHITQIISVDDMDGKVKPGQAISILSRVFDAFDNTVPLLNDGSNIASVTYTAEHYSKGLYDYGWNPIAGHTNVAASTDCVLSQVVSGDDAWEKDTTGYSFLLTPDIRTNPLFTEAGQYRFIITITPTSGNPITVYKEVTVEN